MQILSLYAVTALAFLIIDLPGIRYIIRPVFDRHIPDLLLDMPRVGPAAVFYLAYVAGVVWFVSLPALRAEAPIQALINGAILGALCYATYEFTSYAVMTRWSLEQVITDVVWGTVLTGLTAWAGVAVMTGKLA